MFEKEIKAIYRLNVDKIENLGAFCTFEQIQSAELHPAILQYLSAELDFLIYEDRKKLLKDSVFDYSSEAVQRHFKMMDQEIKTKKRFSIEYIKKLILHSASFNVNFLVRPKWSLLRIIFEEETRKSTEEIVQILNYVYYYDYLKKILTSYLRKKNITSINVHDFEEILEKIDQLEVESYLDTIYDRALSAMEEFFNTGGHTAGRIPLKAVEMFLDEKHLSKELENLRQLPGSGNQYFDPDDLKKIIKGQFNGFDASSMEKTEDKIINEKPKLNFSPKIENILDEKDDNPAVKSQNPPDSIDSKLKKYSFTFNSEDDSEEDEKPVSDPNQLSMADQLLDSVQEVESNPDSGKSTIDEEDTNNNDDTEIIVELDKPFDFDEIEDDFDDSEESDRSNNLPKEIDDISISFDEEVEELEKEIEELPDDEERDNLVIENPDESGKYNEYDEEISDIDDEPEHEADPKELRNSEETVQEQTERNPEIFSIMRDTERKAEPRENKPELTDFLESKNIGKIIENIFDGDMEFFIHTSDLIAKSSSLNEAFDILERVFKSNYVNPSSKDAQNFKSIISEYFDSL